MAVDAAAVQGATGVRIGFTLMNIGNLGVGLVIGFVYSWVITLLIIGFLPFVIILGVFQAKMLTKFSEKDKKILEEAGQVNEYTSKGLFSHEVRYSFPKISNQAISNIRTVAILNKEKYFNEEYSNRFESSYKYVWSIVLFV